MEKHSGQDKELTKDSEDSLKKLSENGSGVGDSLISNAVQKCEQKFQAEKNNAQRIDSEIKRNIRQ